MKLQILPSEEFHARTKPYDLLLPEAEATDAFWAALETGIFRLRQHLSKFGSEDEAWELPGHYQRCRVLFCYFYSDALYCPELLPGIVAALPQDGKPWCIELECYTDAQTGPRDPVLLGWAAIIDGTFYVRGDSKDFIEHVSRFGLQIG